MDDIEALVSRSKRRRESVRSEEIRPYLKPEADEESQTAAIYVTRRLSEADPIEAAEVADLLRHHVAERTTVQLHGEGFRVLSNIAVERPEAALPILPEAIDALDERNAWLRARAFSLLTSLAEAQSDDVRRHVVTVEEGIDDRNELVRTEALAALEALTRKMNIDLSESAVVTLRAYVTGEMPPAPEGGPEEDREKHPELASKCLYNAGETTQTAFGIETR